MLDPLHANHRMIGADPDGPEVPRELHVFPAQHVLLPARFRRLDILTTLVPWSPVVGC